MTTRRRGRRLIASMGDGRYISIGPTDPEGYYTVNYLNHARLASARRRGFSPSEAMVGSISLDESGLPLLQDQLQTGERTFLDEDMIPAALGLIDQAIEENPREAAYRQKQAGAEGI